MKLDLEKGDIILTGRFKNKPVEVKEFGTDEKGQPTINGRPILKFRIKKLIPENKKMDKTKLKQIVKEEVANVLKEQAPRIKKSKEAEDIKKVLMITSGLKKGGGSGRYGREFDKAKQKALKALQDMLTYANIGS